ncbi:hypothetical protein CERSUDRAFT_78882 [Gelatoporia subvermispora B]|uniref:leucyl aminopeptidase n=1 Tax=Ceriporiopsis subvermispora (strain B) TaxID=914234 RepID=M2RQN9_CERS8|nr:hypothetical protein CERSUDRAFT_78882 [Gelatoporia subvermispora B]
MSLYVVPIDPTAQPSAGLPTAAAESWKKVPSGPKPANAGSARVFYGAPTDSDVLAVGSLGEGFAKKALNERRELVRKAVGAAVKQVRDLGEGVQGKTVTVDAAADPHAAAVAAYLAQYQFTLKTSPQSPFNPNAKDANTEKLAFKPVAESKEWDTGVVYARAQNLARTLMELPANMMTPTAFTERVKSEFNGVSNVEIKIRDSKWAAEKGMNTFLSVAKGTNEPPKFLEIHYTGGAKGAQPLVFVGKGITFDSGGISLKPSADMKLMRGDMGGAATVCSAALAIAQLQVPVNLIVLTPLTENLPGPSASKPGDIVYAMNGKSVEIDNTDAEGRLVLSDALYYGSTEFKPHTIVDVATLTGAMDTALGEIYTGVFTNSDSLWDELDAAGKVEFDRFWRMPLEEDYGPQIYSSNADLCNTGGKPAGCCTAALFLKSFVAGVEGEMPAVRWAHVDIAGTMEATRPTPYQERGMTGRPVRALIEFARQLGKQ